MITGAGRAHPEPARLLRSVELPGPTRPHPRGAVTPADPKPDGRLAGRPSRQPSRDGAPASRAARARRSATVAQALRARRPKTSPPSVKPEPERPDREGADRERPCATSTSAASARAPRAPARSAPPRAAACAGRRRPGGRGRGRRRSRGRRTRLRVYSLVRLVPRDADSAASGRRRLRRRRHAHDAGLRDAVPPPRRGTAARGRRCSRHPGRRRRRGARRDRDRLKELACAALRGIDGAAIDAARRDVRRRGRATVAAGRHGRTPAAPPRARARRDPRLRLARRVPRPARATLLEVDGDRLHAARAWRRTAGSRDGSSARTAAAQRRPGASASGSVGAGLADAVLWAYGDSPGDRPLLVARRPSGLGRRRRGWRPSPGSMRSRRDGRSRRPAPRARRRSPISASPRACSSGTSS